MVVYFRLYHSIMSEEWEIRLGQRVQYCIFPKLLMQGKAELAQSFHQLDHVQYMMSDRGIIPHFGVEDGTTSLVPLYVIGCAKGILQHLKHVLWLSRLESATELVAHDSQHDTAHRGPITEPLLVSVSDCSTCIDS